VLRLDTASVACLVLICLVGCATYSTPPPEPARLTVTEKLAEPLTVAPAAPLPEPAVTDHPSAETFVAPGLDGVPWPQSWVNVWLPLETWSKFNRLDKPVQFGNGADASFILQTTNGAFRFRVGSRTVEFCGQDFWLGFAPRSIQGFPYVHSIDARKTLQPLLAAPWQLTRTNRTIVLDPGHGGKDSGAKSCFDGESEKNYALDWAKRLAMLLRECGWNVVLTRTNDVYLTLPDRIAVADRTNADIFVSLHFNAGSENGSQSGIETYCLTPTGMPSSLLREGDDNPRGAYPNNTFDEQNFRLAALLQRSAVKASGAADRGVGRARFMGVLRGQTRPAVLVEGGYLSNPQEAQKIATPEYRQALAKGLARALQ
jgi:N-acetylmuramoyl-L-alanine amidase